MEGIRIPLVALLLLPANNAVVIVPSSYYKHYSLLCQAIHTLNSCSNTVSSLEARNMLKRYYSHFSKLYGERYLTCKLLHLADSVEELGPLYTFSCFDHESANGALDTFQLWFG